MATNNVVNIQLSGIVKYDGISTFSSAGFPLNVSNGGTGASSLDSYQPILGGTSSTSAFQSVTAGSANQVLYGQGSSTKPVWSTIGGRLNKRFQIYMHCSNANLANGTTYYMSEGQAITTYTTDVGPEIRIYPGNSISISAAYGVCVVNGTKSNAIPSATIRLINKAGTVGNITSTLKCNATENTFNGGSGGVGFTGDDNFIRMQFITPTWSTLPTNVSFSVALYGTAT